MANKKPDKSSNDGLVRPSISVRLIRHAESANNQVYRDARFLFRAGTPEFDSDGWNKYVAEHRSADPGLSDIGLLQREKLADFLVPHLLNQASHPVRIVTSPMRRTLETIRPTLERLQAHNDGESSSKCRLLVNAFYHETEGCHNRRVPQEGMNPTEISELCKDCIKSSNDIEFVGFPDGSRGWYADAAGEESRDEAETRAAKFFLWLCEYLDRELESRDDDVFDAGVAIEGEENECEHDKFGKRIRRRRMAFLIGHADFMGLVLKRIVSGFGHYVEDEGLPHRSAFVHHNTGITELEYFGNGRFLLMCSNHTPHFHPDEYSTLRTGGSLKDGWSYIVPNIEEHLEEQVEVAFSDEDIEEHVKEQTDAMKSLYLPSASSELGAGELDVEEVDSEKRTTFVVKRGLQVVACAKYNESTGRLSEVILRPSARKSQVGESLIGAVRKHARKLGRSGSLMIKPTETTDKSFLKDLGFEEVEDDEEHVKIGIDP